MRTIAKAEHEAGTSDTAASSCIGRCARSTLLRERIRHRLSRDGNGRMYHIAAITQIVLGTRAAPTPT